MRVFVDGNLSRVCYVSEDRTIFKTIQLLTTHSNNESEYMAVIAALEDIPGPVEIVSDSQLIVRQLNFEYDIKKEHLRKLAVRVHEQCEGREVIFTWVPRQENLAGRFLG